jgi:hypothetical protein
MTPHKQMYISYTLFKPRRDHGSEIIDNAMRRHHHFRSTLHIAKDMALGRIDGEQHLASTFEGDAAPK